MSAVVSIQHGYAAPWGKALLEDISVCAHAGEVIAIVGPNGAGKSSLLHLLAGGVELTSGQLEFAGQPMAALSVRERARNIAFLAQKSSLNFAFTAREVVALSRHPHSSGSEADQNIVEEVMLATDTQQLADRVYPQLSGGEQQRVQIAGTLAQLWRAQDSEQRLLLLDEPCNGLDLAHQALLQQLIRQRAADACAVVLVVHDFNFAAAIADKIVVLHQGKIATIGRPQEALSPDIFKQVFETEPLLVDHPDGERKLVVLP